MSFLGEFNELYVNLTYRCNLDCPFCSTKAGGFFNKSQDMTPEIALACVDILLHNSATPEPVLFFFGGEPLLKVGLIRRAVEHGRKHEAEAGRRIRFVIITNGVLIDDELLAFLATHRVDLQVNLDGPKASHDSLRYFPDRTGTFDGVIERIRKAEAACGFQLTLRSHVPPDNPHFLETMDMLESWELRRFNLAFNMVMGLGSDSEFLWKREDFERHEDRFLEFVRRYPENILLQRQPTVDFFGLRGYYFTGRIEPEHFCNAGRVRLSVGPRGDVYPCFTMEDQEEFCIGHIDQGINLFQVTRFLTVTSGNGLRADDGSPVSDLFMYLCPFQNWSMSGRLNVVSPVLRDSYRGFSTLVGKMKQALAGSTKSKLPKTDTGGCSP